MITFLNPSFLPYADRALSASANPLSVSWPWLRIFNFSLKAYNHSMVQVFAAHRVSKILGNTLKCTELTKILPVHIDVQSKCGFSVFSISHLIFLIETNLQGAPFKKIQTQVFSFFCSSPRQYLGMTYVTSWQHKRNVPQTCAALKGFLMTWAVEGLV